MTNQIRLSCAFFAIALMVFGSEIAAREVGSGPRMILEAETIEKLKSAARTDEDTRLRLEKLRASADAILKLPPVVQRFETANPDKPFEMLFAARVMLKRMTELGLAWNLWGDKRHAARGRTELLGAVTLDTWAPDQFLATAEMLAAVSIGLDWFSDYLSDAEKQTIVNALVKLGIEPGLEYYERTGLGSYSSWAVPRPRDESLIVAAKKAGRQWAVNSFNWNMVCNSGMALAALAIRPYRPKLSERVLSHTVSSISYGFAEYGDDGGFPEGPEYWSLATRYAAAFVSASNTVLGHDFGFGDTPGLRRTGDFILHVTGPTGLAFNFGDSDTKPNRTAMSWLSVRYGRPVDAWFARNKSPGSRLALSLVWRVADNGENPIQTDTHTDHHFESVGVATFRSAWMDPQALFAGLKGGDSGGHHTHLDLGTFVFDGKGQRWAIELGRGNYSLPGYFTDKRWTYYRTGTVGQNTLMFAGQNQIPGAVAPITAFYRSPSVSYAIADLGRAYGVPANSIRRGLAMFEGRKFLVQDEIGGDKPDPVRWGMHTRAKVAVNAGDPAAMVLSQEGTKLGARILSPPGAQFSVVSAHQSPPQKPNKGVAKVVIDLDGVPAGTRREIAVLFEPGTDEPPEAVELVPLADWEAAWQSDVAKP